MHEYHFDEKNHRSVKKDGMIFTVKCKSDLQEFLYE